MRRSRARAASLSLAHYIHFLCVLAAVAQSRWQFKLNVPGGIFIRPQRAHFNAYDLREVALIRTQQTENEMSRKSGMLALSSNAQQFTMVYYYNTLVLVVCILHTACIQSAQQHKHNQKIRGQKREHTTRNSCSLHVA